MFVQKGTCNTTGCYTVAVTVNSNSTAPTSAAGNPSLTVCPGTAMTLTEIGGSLGTGSTWAVVHCILWRNISWEWINFNITSALTTNYYVRAEGTCGTTGCYTAVVTVQFQPLRQQLQFQEHHL